MEIFFGGVLLMIDIWLIISIQRLGHHKKQSDDSLLGDITEERRLLRELQNSIRIELQQAQASQRQVLEKVTQLAIEAEQEVKNGGQTLAGSIEAVYGEFRGKFETSFQHLTKKQNEIEVLFKRLSQEKALLGKMIQRAETLSRFFDGKLSYDDILKDIQDKKYVDARKLLRQGMAPNVVAKELGLNETDVRLIASVVPLRT